MYYALETCCQVTQLQSPLCLQWCRFDTQKSEFHMQTCAKLLLVSAHSYFIGERTTWCMLTVSCFCHCPAGALLCLVSPKRFDCVWLCTQMGDPLLLHVAFAILNSIVRVSPCINITACQAVSFLKKK